MNDYYAILGIAADANAKEIKRAYRTLARRFHPDRNKAVDAEERFKAIGAAYAVLGDPARRQRYDAELAGAQSAIHTQMNGDQMSMDSELFEAVFRQIFGGAEQAPDDELRSQPYRRGNASSSTTEIELSLEEAHAGVIRILTLTEPLASGTRSQQIRIPAGARDGQILRIPGLANRAPPLRVRVRVAPHPLYEWQHEQLVRRLDLTPWEASLGAVLPVDTLAGRVMLRIPAGTRAGQTLRIAGKGFAGADLMVRIAVDAPAPMTDEQRRAYDALRRSFEQCA